jgi:hypothetical protein
MMSSDICPRCLATRQARLAGFEPATRCLEGTANVARMMRDVHFLGLMTRYQPGQAGAVATNGGYRVGSARTWPSLRQAPLNPCGAAVQRPEGLAQRRERSERS